MSSFSTAQRLIGVWSNGLPRAPGVPEVTAAAIDWPRGMVGNIEIMLVDQDGEVFDVDLAVLTNHLVFSVRQTIESDPLVELSATSTGAPGSYMWQVPLSATLDLSGRLVYDVFATRDGVTRQVVTPSYFNVTARILR